jgi:hypothetical protein
MELTKEQYMKEHEFCSKVECVGCAVSKLNTEEMQQCFYDAYIQFMVDKYEKSALKFCEKIAFAGAFAIRTLNDDDALTRQRLIFCFQAVPHSSKKQEVYYRSILTNDLRFSLDNKKDGNDIEIAEAFAEKKHDKNILKKIENDLEREKNIHLKLDKKCEELEAQLASKEKPFTSEVHALQSELDSLHKSVISLRDGVLKAEKERDHFKQLYSESKNRK